MGYRPGTCPPAASHHCQMLKLILFQSPILQRLEQRQALLPHGSCRTGAESARPSSGALQLPRHPAQEGQGRLPLPGIGARPQRRIVAHLRGHLRHLGQEAQKAQSRLPKLSFPACADGRAEGEGIESEHRQLREECQGPRPLGRVTAGADGRGVADRVGFEGFTS